MKTDFDQYAQDKIKKHPFLKEELKKADLALDIAMQVYNLRKKAGLTQNKLAELVGTSQPHIARIESGDYKSYSRNSLEKIAKALKARVEVKIVPIEGYNQSVNP